MNRPQRLARRARRAREQRTKLIGGGLVGAVAVTMVVLLVLNPGGNPDLDLDGCPNASAYAGQIAILADPSDSLTNVQQSVTPRILDLIEEAEEATEIRVYTLARAGRGDTTSVFRACVPRHPDDVSQMTGNPRIAARRYDDFQASLGASLSAVLSARGDSVSPLAEGIQAAVVNAFQPRGATMTRQLFIVSDMLQHSSLVSFYRAAPEFGSLARRPEYGTLRVDMSGVAVTVFLLARSGQAGRIQLDSMRQFWEDYFLDQGAHPSARPQWVAVEG